MVWVISVTRMRGGAAAEDAVRAALKRIAELEEEVGPEELSQTHCPAPPTSCAVRDLQCVVFRETTGI